MGKLNFKECNVIYDLSILHLETSHNKIKINYNFTKSLEENIIIKIFLNTVFIQNLLLSFSSKEKLSLNLELRKGEQNFVYRNIKVNLIGTTSIPLEEINPYTSSIYLIISNNHKSGSIIIEKIM